MKRWTLIAFSLCMTLVFNQSGLLAKGGRGQGGDMGTGRGNAPAFSQNSHGNGQGTVDRDFGKDRAAEVGRGKKKGLHKNHNRGAHHKSNDKVKKLHQDKKDKH